MEELPVLLVAVPAVLRVARRALVAVRARRGRGAAAPRRVAHGDALGAGVVEVLGEGGRHLAGVGRFRRFSLVGFV